MLRKLSQLLTLAALVAATVGVAVAPASANPLITATSVDLAASASCSDASLALGLQSGAVTSEYGRATTLDAELDQFGPHGTALANFNGVYPNYVLGPFPTQDEGTIIGSYAWVGVNPPSASNTAEWFVLYRCGSAGENTILTTCFGDYGTCPRTAAEGLAEGFSATVDDDTPDPGQTITVSAEGCRLPLGGALLLDGDTSLDGDSVAPAPDGTFEVDLTVPADTPPGTELTVRVDCGFEGETVSSLGTPVTVGGATPTTPTTSTTSAPTTTVARAATVTPRFTG